MHLRTDRTDRSYRSYAFEASRHLDSGLLEENARLRQRNTQLEQEALELGEILEKNQSESNLMLAKIKQLLNPANQSLYGMQISRLRQQVTTLTAKNYQLLKTQELFVDRIKNLESQLSAMGSIAQVPQLNELVRQLGDYKGQVDCLSATVNSLSEQNDKLKREKEQLRIKYSSLHAEAERKNSDNQLSQHLQLYEQVMRELQEQQARNSRMSQNEEENRKRIARLEQLVSNQKNAQVAVEKSRAETLLRLNLARKENQQLKEEMKKLLQHSLGTPRFLGL